MKRLGLAACLAAGALSASVAHAQTYQTYGTGKACYVMIDGVVYGLSRLEGVAGYAGNGQSYGFSLGGGVYVPPTPVPPTPVPPAPTPPTPTPSTILDGTVWTLVTLNGAPFTADAVLNFNAGGNAGGEAPCNVYGSDFTALSDFSIDFGPVISTRRACPELSQEQAYFAMLEQATDFRLGREGDSLALLDASGATIAVFNRGDTTGGPGGSGVDLTGAWRITGIDDGTTFVTGDAQLSSLNITFNADGTYSGNGGCNQIFGDYAASGTSVTVLNVAATARACFAPAPYEDDMIRNLPLLAAARMEPGGAVSLLDANGRVLFRLER